MLLFNFGDLLPKESAADTPYRAYHERKLDPAKVAQAAADQLFGEDKGFCLHCGHEHTGIKPMEGPGRCSHCLHEAVYGAERILLMGEGV